MDADKVLRNLKILAGDEKNNQVCTFEIRVADMAADAAETIEQLQVFTKQILALPTCQECEIQKTCGYCPRIGQTVRYHCPLYVGPRKVDW